MPPIEDQELEQEQDLNPEEDFSDLLALEDEVSDSSEEEVEAEEPAPEVTDEGEEEPAAEAETEVAEEEEVPGDQTEEEQPQETPPEEEPPSEEAEEQPDLETAKAQWLEELQGSYKLTDEEADQFVTEPEKIVPKLAAIVHQRAVQETLQAVAQMMPQYLQQALTAQPQIIESTLTQAQAAKEAETQFFTAFPDLKAHGAKVMEVAKFVRQAPENKDIGKEELMVKIGNATRALLGVQAPATPPPQEEQRQQRPFTPAQPGGASGGEAPSAAKSEWDELIELELP